MTVDQILESNNRLHDIKEAPFHSLVVSFGNYIYEYVRSMMTLYFPRAVGPAGVTYSTAVHIIDARKLPKDGNCMIMLCDRYWCRSVELLRGKVRVECAWEPLRTRYAFHVDGKPICQLKISN